MVLLVLLLCGTMLFMNKDPRKSTRRSTTPKTIGDKLRDMPLLDPQKRAENHYGRRWMVSAGSLALLLYLGNGIVNHVGQVNSDPFNTKNALETVYVGSVNDPPYTPQGIIDQNYPSNIYFNGDYNYYLLQFLKKQTKNESDILYPGEALKIPTEFKDGQKIATNKQD